jgi:hypothetical protein
VKVPVGVTEGVRLRVPDLLGVTLIVFEELAVRVLDAVLEGVPVCVKLPVGVTEGVRLRVLDCV